MQTQHWPVAQMLGLDPSYLGCGKMKAACVHTLCNGKRPSENLFYSFSDGLCIYPAAYFSRHIR
ncbi:hypothetical protein [Neisseria bacilliformis]|uniref:hypothetical protein n=1 Tax=Neisseria bacilliformis TaxID=267212 RepID=UPI0028E68258|nr:hypothetical protein [Neisseria bacilliformis]